MERQSSPFRHGPESGSGGDRLRRVPDALRRFLELFNAQRYWESHEVLEDPWREQGSDFYHGLILYASAFVHAQRRNAHGVDAQLVKAERKLDAFRTGYLGIDVGAILVNAARCRAVLERSDGRDSSVWSQLTEVPGLSLDARFLRGDEPELE